MGLFGFGRQAAQKSSQTRNKSASTIGDKHDTLVFLDVETPNAHNDRICSIGVIKTDLSGVVVDERYFLVDPETHFDDLNMRIHGIRPIDVRGAKTFPELWDTYLSDIMRGCGYVAHNAKFDLCVLSKLFDLYGIDRPKMDYACTLQMAQSSSIGFASCKLPDVCATLGIPLASHHNAADDAAACKAVFWALVSEQRRLPDISTYNYRPRGQRTANPNRPKSESTESMQFLMLLIEDAIKDGDIETDEAMDILDYISGDEKLSSDPSVSSLAALLQKCVIDGSVDEDESKKLMAAFEAALDPTKASSGDVEFDGKNFVLTGTFDHGTREQMEDFVISKGGTILKSVTKKCDYVVIGGQGSELYALGNYGTKVKKALDWQSKGVPVQIVNESALFI